MTRRVLVVCTANVCRSAMGEALLRQAAAARGVDVEVRSAGVRVPGLPVDPDAVRTLAPLGLDISGHRPTQASRELVSGADLVVTMTREHLRDIVGIDRSAWPKTFTLPEVVRRARRVPFDVTAWDTWLAALGEGRTARDMLAADPADDIDDPYGMSLAVHQRSADLIGSLLRELVDLAPFDRVDAQGAGRSRPDAG